MESGSEASAFAENLLETLQLANAGGTEAAVDVARVDPVSLLHAIELAPSALREPLAEAYALFVQRCSSAGLELIPPQSAPVAHRLLERLGLCPGPVERSQPSLKQFTVATFALCALDATSLGEVRFNVDAPSLRTLSRASMLLAARRRSFADAGLGLLAHSLCFADDDVSHILAWLQRTRRSDGIYGTWDLFDDAASTATLAASVNVAWALSVRGQTKAVRAPDDSNVSASALGAFAVELLSEDDLEAISSAITGLQKWLEQHLDLFCARRFSSQEQYADGIKQLIELVLTLWIINRCCPAQAPWAVGLARKVRERVAGEGLVEALRIFPTTILAALMFPMLAELTGTPSDFEAEVQALVEDDFSLIQERIPMRKLDFLFLKSLYPDLKTKAEQQIDRLLGDTLLAGCPNPAYLGSDSAYDITHAIFYATRFGSRPLAADHTTLAWCERWIPELCLSFILEGDLDIGAEFLINWVQLTLHRDESFAISVRLLLKGLRPDGSAPGPPSATKKGGSDFEMNYHTTLVVLVALCEIAGRE